MFKKVTSLRFALMILAFTFCFISFAGSQSSPYPMADQIAQNVIGHYQQSSCQALWKEKMQGPGVQKAQQIQNAVEIMRNNPDMRKYFLNKIAAPIVNKEFECGMIP